jgi:hypothetical protein
MSSLLHSHQWLLRNNQFSDPEYKPVSLETHVPRSFSSKDLVSPVYAPSQTPMKREDIKSKKTA